MQWAILALMGTACLMAGRRIRQLRKAGESAAARRCYRLSAWLLGGTILAAMAVQETILLLSGLLSWQTGLPLHLCSLLGLLTLPALLTRRETLLDGLLLAGVPGALLALLFPAALTTPWPRLTLAAFHTLHAGLVCAPLLPLYDGWRPGPRSALRAWGLLLGAGGAALIANHLTGGNYLFLSGPVAGTPLTWLARWGRGPYRLLLAGLAGAVLTLESLVWRRLRPGRAR